MKTNSPYGATLEDLVYCVTFGAFTPGDMARLHGGGDDLAQRIRDNAPSHAVGLWVEQLESEGWRFLTVPGRQGGFWLHESGYSVNLAGGPFPSVEAATRAAYSSPLRETLHKKARM